MPDRVRRKGRLLGQGGFAEVYLGEYVTKSKFFGGFMQRGFLQSRRHPVMAVILLFMLVFTLVACDSGGNGGTTNKSTSQGTATNNQGSNGSNTTPTVASIQMGAQTCPTAVSAPTYWAPIVPTQANINKVEKVTCANLTGNTSLQALVTVRSQSASATLDVYVYNKITSPNPTKLLMLQSLQGGEAKISAYNTVVTIEADAGSKVNTGKSNGAFTKDLGREFKWSDGAGTLVPIAFSGIYPVLTRYEAEDLQQQVNQGKSPLLSASQVALNFATNAKLLGWPATTQPTLNSGGGDKDEEAQVTVKNPISNATAKVTLDRLEQNTNGGIWIVTAVTSDAMSISAPPSPDNLTSPVTITGQGSASAGKVGKVTILNHLYDAIGNAQANGVAPGGNTTFSTGVSYTRSFKTGSEDGIVAFYANAGSDGSAGGVVMIKDLLS